MRVVFLGSPDFAVPSLVRLHEEFEVVGVVSQPDRPKGRGRELQAPPVKIASLEYGLYVLQPSSMKDPKNIEMIRQLQPELIIVVAYGQILPPDLLNLAPHGALNVHASLLPRWRGAAPIQAAILNGDIETGVTIMKMDEGLDTGPILSQNSIRIISDETGGELSKRLSLLGAELLIASIPAYIEDRLSLVYQDDALASYAPRLKKKDGWLDLSKDAEYLARQVRAYYPWPGSFLTWNGNRLNILKAAVLKSESRIGHASEYDGYPVIGTSSSGLVLKVVQPAGKKAMPGDAFLRGSPSFIGSELE